MPNKVSALTHHALERFMKRTGNKKPVASMQKLFLAAEQGTPLGNNRFYYRGLVVVVVNGEVKTAFKPHRRDIQEQIYHALNPKS